MIKFITIFIVAAAYLSPMVMSEAQMVETDLDTIMKNCKTNFPITDETISFLHATGSLKDETDDKAMCYFNCVMEGMGVVKDGVFQLNEQVKAAEKLLDRVKKPDGTMHDISAVKMDMENCSKLQGENKCRTTYAIVRCIEKKRRELGITKPNN